MSESERRFGRTHRRLECKSDPCKSDSHRRIGVPRTSPAWAPAAGVVTALLLGAVAGFMARPATAMSSASDELDAALRVKPRLDRGAEIFEMCAACHGQDGQGAADGSVPAIAGQTVPVLVKQIVEFRYDARLSIRMQHFVDHHHLTAPQELADIAAYVSSLPPRQPSSPREPAPPEPVPSSRGAGLFAGLCASCHGAHAEGDPAARVPRLSGQHREYLAEQLHDAAEGRRPSMSRDHARLLSRLSGDDLDVIAEYLAAVAPATPAAPGTAGSSVRLD